LAKEIMHRRMNPVAVEAATLPAEQAPNTPPADQPEDFSDGNELKRVNES
jgi:hypothetical protein